jgi:hypothetical protein
MGGEYAVRISEAWVVVDHEFKKVWTSKSRDAALKWAHENQEAAPDTLYIVRVETVQ